MMSQPVKGFAALFFVVCSFACPPALAHSASKELPLEEVLKVLSLGDFRPSLSRDGKWLAYVVQNPRRTGQPHKTQRFFLESGTPAMAVGTDVWITETDSGQTTNLTKGRGANWGMSWSPDGNFLAFYSDRDGAARLWVFDIRTRKMRRVSETVVRALDYWQVPVWSPNGKMILTRLLPDNQRIGEMAKGLVGEEHTPAGENDAVHPKVLIYRSSAEDNATPVETSNSIVQSEQTKAEDANLGAIDFSTGAIQWSARGFRPVWYSWSPDGSSVVFATMKGAYRGEPYRQLFDLLRVSPGEKPRVIDSDISKGFWNVAASWAPDGSRLAYIATGDADDGECYIVTVDGSGRRKATKDPHPPLSLLDQVPLWDGLGQHLYFVTPSFSIWTISLRDGKAHELTRIPDHHILTILTSSEGSRVATSRGGHSMIVMAINDATAASEFHRIDLDTGASENLLSESKGYDPYRAIVSGDAGKLIYAAENVAHPADFFLLDTDSKSVRRLTNIDAALDGFQMGDSRLIQWRTGDGDVVRGALLLPSNYQKGTKYPLIVEVYPGLFSPCVNQFGLCGQNFFPNKQLFATRGYAVLVPDLRLTGRTVLRDLANIVLPGVNQAIDLGIVDADRVGLMGTSWGGYSTLALLVQTTRFKAGVMVAGFGDLFGFYGEMDEGGASLGVSILDEGNGRFQMPGPPWSFRDVYLENSPIFYLDRLETPLLIIHGTRDTNVAPFLGDEVFVGLRRLKKQATYVKYVGEVHGIHSHENQVDSFKRLLDWFDTYLRGRQAADQVGKENLQ
jgi:dipeptidyl aminopeptidase/acylaminoacyl peptidase